MVQPARRVVCTGIGMVTPLALGAKKSWTALLASKVGTVKLKDEHSYQGCQSKVAAYVPENEFKDELNSSQHEYMIRHAKQLSRATNFAILAAHEALDDARLLDSSGQVEEKFRTKCGVVIGQGMVDFQDIYENADLLATNSSRKGGYKKISPYFMTRALINMSAGNVSIRYKLKGLNHCASTACATGAHSIGDAYNFIKNDKADIMICGSTEAAINNLSMAGFDRLKALCTKFNDNPQVASRPFDINRGGFVMGEGAGIVILEEMEHAKKRSVSSDKVYCEILGYGMSSDAHHLTAPLPDGGGAKMCMRSALRDAQLEPSAIGHINAHATSTPLGDEIECNAIEDLFYEKDDNQEKLTVTSCKSSIGHLLGAAGSVESIFAMLSCQQALLPHCMNLDQPLSTSRNLINFVRLKPKHWASDRRVLLKNSFGFGGTNASLVISNYTTGSC